MSQYLDIYMRDALGDTGQKPDPARIYWVSPDIIPSGTAPTPNYQQLFASNWAQDVGQNLVVGTMNYIYVRGMNAYTGAETGTIQLYYANSSLLLQASQWITNVIQTANNSPTTAVSASAQNAVVVGADAFQWTPTQPQGGSHFCLIALVGTSNNPAPVPTGDFANSAAFVTWLLDNPSAVQRNITIVNYPPPPSWQQSQVFINLDAVAEEYMFQVDVSPLPAGTVVSFSCSAAGPTPPINASTTVPPNGPSPNWLSQNTQLPAGFSSSLVLTLQIPQGSQPPPQGITVDYARVTQSHDDEILKRHAKPVHFFYPGCDLDADIEVVIMGSCTIRFQQPS
ncbi:MAG: hypothetical protein QOH01_1809 [Verrucomicrobiota bacterium]|jgi:hypothetical protein